MKFNMIFNDGSRTTMLYSRYLMCIKLGRVLESYEHVDHIDGNKMNDALDNLQILSQHENNIKSVIENSKSMKLIELVCPICENKFYRSKQKVNFKLKNGKTPTCSRTCGVKYGHLNRGSYDESVI